MTSDAFETGPLADVAYEESGGKWTLVFVRDLRHPPEKVWAALTEPGQLGEWAPYTADRDLGSVGDVTLITVDGESHERLPATVLRAERPTVLEHTWGDDRLRWHLAATATGTRLTLRHTVDSEDTLAQVAAGWHLCLIVAEHLLDDTPIAPIRGHDALNFGWEDLRHAYTERLQASPEPKADVEWERRLADAWATLEQASTDT